MKAGRGEYTDHEKQQLQQLSENLKTLQTKNGKKMTQIEIAQGSGIPQGSISRYLRGKMFPKPEYIQKLAEFFDVPAEQIDPRIKSTPIQTKAPSELVQAINDKVVQLHLERQEIVLEVATAQLDEQENETLEIREEPAEYNSDKIIAFSRKDNDFESLIVHGLESAGDGIWQENDVDIEVRIPKDEIPDEFDDLAMVIGDSMRPKLHNGDILFVTFTKQIEIGQIGVFRTSKGNFVKKLQPDRLESLNPNYDDIYFNEDEFAEVIGVVEDIYRK